jgi:hypothetical protein
MGKSSGGTVPLPVELIDSERMMATISMHRTREPRVVNKIAYASVHAKRAAKEHKKIELVLYNLLQYYHLSHYFCTTNSTPQASTWPRFTVVLYLSLKVGVVSRPTLGLKLAAGLRKPRRQAVLIILICNAIGNTIGARKSRDAS